MSGRLKRVILASANPDKTAEIVAVMGALLPEVVLVPRPVSVPDVVEDGETLLANARLKAVAVAEATGEPALADDTGLEVQALEGGPGVLTARFAGEGATYAQNVAKMLNSLAEAGAVGAAARRARFRTVAMVRWPDGSEVWAEGALDGVIADAPRGDHGFGYDPVFVADEGGGRTFAELGPELKNRLSHRARALRALAAKLGALADPA